MVVGAEPAADPSVKILGIGPHVDSDVEDLSSHDGHELRLAFLKM
jgi:hypothetical protein